MKHLSFSERCLIEHLLSVGSSFRDIAQRLSRQPSTISREVKNNRTFISPRKARCMHYHDCHRKKVCLDCTSSAAFCKICNAKECNTVCDRFEAFRCAKLDRAPFVCNHCPTHDVCTKLHAYYTARKADAKSRSVLSDSRRSIHLNPQEVSKLNELVTPLILNGQSPSHIFMTCREQLGISKTTLYSYIDKGILDVRNLDLPRKVRYKKRRAAKRESFPYQYRIGRTYEDFQQYMALHPDACTVEMDTVIGKREKGKCLLTMIFVKYEFMLIFLLDHCTQDSVRRVFEYLQKELGLAVFRRLFQVILTDNGREFKNPEFMEFTKHGAPCCNVFYCDAMASWQKPHIENAHHLIRRILPKGQSFDALTPEDISLIMTHINSYSREQLNGQCPFEAAKPFIERKAISVLKLQRIPPEHVCLTPALLK